MSAFVEHTRWLIPAALAAVVAAGCGAKNQPAVASSDSYRYAIRVRGHLDSHWSEWLEGILGRRLEGYVYRAGPFPARV